MKGREAFNHLMYELSFCIQIANKIRISMYYTIRWSETVKNDRRAISISQKGKNIALSNFTESPYKRSLTLTMNGRKQARHSREWKLKRKTGCHTETGIEFKYILNSEPRLWLDEIIESECSKCECFLISLACSIPLTASICAPRDAAKWIIFFVCSFFEKQFCGSFSVDVPSLCPAYIGLPRPAVFYEIVQ